MSSEASQYRFLLDENVKHSLEVFLKKRGLEAIRAGKGMTDKELAARSKKEKLILITNDSDFANPGEEKIFSVIWLRLPQSDRKKMLDSFATLIEKVDSFEGKMIILKEDGFSAVSF